MTKYEKAVYDIINTSREHPTVEQVFEKLREAYPGVVLATVYNNLNKLYENHLIRKVSTGGNQDRYDRIEKHDHLICRQCGKIEDILFEDLMPSLRRQMGEEILTYDLKVFSLCPACREKAKAGLWKQNADLRHGAAEEQ